MRIVMGALALGVRSQVCAIVVLALVGQAGARAAVAGEAELEAAYESCHHWAGEEAYSSARGREIARGAKRDCTAAAKVASAALAQREHSAKVAGLLLRIADVTGNANKAVWKKRIPQLCVASERYFAELVPADDADAQSTVIELCPALARKLYPGSGSVRPNAGNPH
jgi:hypothetical protein